jgi:hypothetical protein
MIAIGIVDASCEDKSIPCRGEHFVFVHRDQAATIGELNDLHDQSLAHGVKHDLSRVVQVQLLHEICPMRFHC